jgi:hypothetical protein
MQMRKWVIALGVVGLTASAAAVSSLNFGLFRDDQLSAHSEQLFGINEGLDASSTESVDAFTANSVPTSLVTLAKGLHARVVTARSNAGANIDMMALWPNDANPTHLIACNEQGTTEPGVQRIRLVDGVVETILSGTSSCDPIRRTAWGTILIGEEVGGTGWLFELINPLATTNVTFDRNSGTFSGADAGNLAVRPAVGRLAFEGLGLYPNGMLYYGDEKRPGTDTAGGAYFKFIPTTPFSGFAPIANLAQSPLVSGKVYGLRLGRRSGNTDYGHGSNTGQGVWIEVPNSFNANLTTASVTLKLTGYYRPEDAEIDPGALADGNVRVCANNTGNESNDRNWGEMVCITDGTLQQATANTAIPELQYFVIGTPELAMMDNLAYQPNRGNWILHEDGDGPDVGRNNDLWACLEDGDDADSLSDGCIRIGTLNDLNAGWTGGIFDRWGDHFYVSVQHNVTGHGVVLDITGWR